MKWQLAASAIGLATLSQSAFAVDYFIRGSWDGYTPDVLLTEVGGGGIYQGTKAGLVPGNEYTFKVGTADWSFEQPGSFQDLKVRANSNGKIHVNFFLESNPADGWLPNSPRIGLVNLEKNYELIGSMTGWSSALPFNQPSTGFFERNVILAGGASYAWKFRGEGGDWAYDIGNNFAYNAGDATLTTFVDGIHKFQLDLPNGRYRAVQGNAALGSITFGDWGGDPISSVNYDIIDANTNDVIASGTATLFSGTYAIAGPVPGGPWKLGLKGDRWLRKVVDVDTTNGAVSDVNVTLISGDVDGDNAVTIFDYIELSGSFDLNLGDTGYVATADLDGDNSVTIFDYIILSGNFDLSGD
mgnify:FL=1